ncbi:MAG: ABC transporter ATP-binding protein [Desulfobacteraceae bacterium]|nr:ABC transporter ATP-binding protein [Desulfobacteraceae bacterium]
MDIETPIVKVNELDFSYGNEPVLENVSFSIRQGDFVAVIGPNGGGKTTLLKLMLGLLKPQNGTIEILGSPAGKVSHLIGYVPQDVHINSSFPITTLDVVLMGKLGPDKRWAKNSAGNREEARQALDRMGMSGYENHRIGELSGGQRQRVFIARALATNPRLLLLDEPTASIDSKGQTDFFKLLKSLNEHMTILVVSHDLLVISTHVKSVACVNRRLHYHNDTELTGDMLETMYPCTVEDVCPVELVAHGVPHRVLKQHKE